MNGWKQQPHRAIHRYIFHLPHNDSVRRRVTEVNCLAPTVEGSSSGPIWHVTLEGDHQLVAVHVKGGANLQTKATPLMAGEASRLGLLGPTGGGGME